jgi:hypothetical protein
MIGRNAAIVKLTRLTRCLVSRAQQEDFDELAVKVLYPTFGWTVGTGPSRISARRPDMRQLVTSFRVRREDGRSLAGQQPRGR